MPNSDTVRCSTDQRNATKGVPYMWAQYPHGEADSSPTIGPPYSRGNQQSSMTEKDSIMSSIYNRDDGG